MRCEGELLDLPAGPAYRVEKEIKNVITVIAKTCHYWMGHMWRTERRAIGELFAVMARESPLVEPAWPADEGRGRRLRRHADRLAETLRDDHRSAPVAAPPPAGSAWSARASALPSG